MIYAYDLKKLLAGVPDDARVRVIDYAPPRMPELAIEVPRTLRDGAPRSDASYVGRAVCLEDGRSVIPLRRGGAGFICQVFGSDATCVVSEHQIHNATPYVITPTTRESLRRTLRTLSVADAEWVRGYVASRDGWDSDAYQLGIIDARADA